MSVRGLQVADGVVLPAEYVTKTTAILAQRRRGKSYTAHVIAEELCASRLPWVALDPTGAWWGLLAAANGVDPGLSVVVLGGQHGHLPLERDGGRFIADLVLEHPGWYVLDLSLLGSKRADREFAAGFADRLYRRKMESGMGFPLHLFVDEADMFVPQDRETGDMEMLGAFQSIVRRGGLHGLGTTLISQRPALVNKSVLTQLDMLILLRLVAGNDQDYLDKNYISRAGSKEQRALLMESMASLGLGEAWLWEPGAEPILFERTRIRERRTFNSSATPKVGEARVEPRRLADVDIAVIKDRMAEAVERAEADNPERLRQRIRGLQAELAKVRAAQQETVSEEEIESRVEAWGEKAVAAAVDAVGSEFSVHAAAVDALQEEFAAGLRRLRAESAERLQQISPPRPSAVQRPSRAASTPPVREVSPARAPARERTRTPDSGSGGDGSLDEPQQRVVDAVRWWHDVGIEHPSKIQVGFVAGYRVGKTIGGKYGGVLGQLRALGLLDYPAPGRVQLTGEGERRARAADIEPTTEGLQRAVFARLGDSEQRVLQQLIDVYPEPLSKQELGQRAGYRVGKTIGGKYGGVLGQLRALGLLDYPQKGSVVALPILFLKDE